jgi:hypothetical protein
LPLPMPAQPATLTATRVATKAMSTFFIGSPFFTPRDAHLVPRYPVGRPLPSMRSLPPETAGHFEGDCVLGDTVGPAVRRFPPVTGRSAGDHHPVNAALKTEAAPGSAPLELLGGVVPRCRTLHPTRQRYHGKIPQSRALRRVIHRRRSCPNWDTFGVKCPLIPWGCDTTPRSSLVVSIASCVSVPRSVIAGLFFGSTPNEKALGVCPGPPRAS